MSMEHETIPYIQCINPEQQGIQKGSQRLMYVQNFAGLVESARSSLNERRRRNMTRASNSCRIESSLHVTETRIALRVGEEK